MIWCAKPWLDRTILFVLSRAAFGQRTTLGRSVARAAARSGGAQLLFTLTVRRLSPWRSFTSRSISSKGCRIRQASARVRQIRTRQCGTALHDDARRSRCGERASMLALFSLVFWFAPAATDAGLLATDSRRDAATFCWFALPIAYAIAVLFLEPFYVAAGFAMYLNRRAELEAWDIEQEFRRAFAR